jgi:hypothetical protein
MLTVACVYKSGGPVYDADYVKRLTYGIRSVMQEPYQLVCLTDRPREIAEYVDRTELLDDRLQGWWAKMQLFRLTGPLLYFDLDTVIIGDISGLCDAVQNKIKNRLLMLGDFYKPKIRQSGILGWSGDKSWIADKFFAMLDNGYEYRQVQDTVRLQVNGSLIRGDGELLHQWASDSGTGALLAQHVQPGIYSYKCHVKPRDNKPEQDAAVICFHGSPRPHEIDQPWIRGIFHKGITNYPLSHDGTLFVCGSAECMTEDLHSIMIERSRFKIAAIGHAAGMVKADFVVSDHYEVHKELKRLQRQLRGDSKFSNHCTYCDRVKDNKAIDHWWKWSRSVATSAETAIRMGITMGFDEIVLCGCPLEMGRIQHPRQQTKDGEIWPPPRNQIAHGPKDGYNTSGDILYNFRLEFARRAPVWRDNHNVRSMSGFTRERLGPPNGI